MIIGNSEITRYPYCPMKKLTIALIATLSLFAIGSPAQAKSCSKIGSMSGTQAKPLVCQTVKGKRIWVSQVAATVKRTPGALSQNTSGVYLGSIIGISVSWGFPYDIGSSPVTAYRLEYMMANTPWIFVANLSPNQYIQNITDNRPANNYFRYRVAAVNAHGVGVFSETDWILYGSASSNSGSTTATSTATPIATTTTTVAPTTTTTTVALTTTTTTVYVTNSRTQAVKSATSYLRFMSFSRSGLIKQLEYEKFSFEDATYGVDAQNADWNAQASKVAASYLKTMSFSRSGLISQLVYEGFTQSQAEYGVSTTGL